MQVDLLLIMNNAFVAEVISAKGNAESG